MPTGYCFLLFGTPYRNNTSVIGIIQSQLAEQCTSLIPLGAPCQVIFGSVMSSMLIMASTANRIPSLKPRTNDIISFLSPSSDAQSLNFSKVSCCVCVSVSINASSFRVNNCSMCEYAPPLTTSRSVGLMVAVIQFLYDTSHVATSFGRDTQYQNSPAISRR